MKPMKTAYKPVEAAIYNFQHWIEDTNPVTLKNQFEGLVTDSGFTILQFSEHHFEQQGYTCFWLLAESHLAIHTFPESNKTYVELSSCNADKLAQFKSLLHA